MPALLPLKIQRCILSLAATNQPPELARDSSWDHEVRGEARGEHASLVGGALHRLQGMLRALDILRELY